MTPKELAKKKMAKLSPSVYIYMNKTTEDAYVDGFQDGYKEGEKRLLKLIKSEHKCPECGGELAHEGGCTHCLQCGWAACSND